MHLLSNTSQMRKKCGTNKNLTYELLGEWVTDTPTTFNF